MNEIQQLRIDLLSSLLEFTITFYKIRTGREFVISQPVGRESHIITICKALTKVFYGDTKRLIINVPPRYGKTEQIIQFCAWALAHYPDSNFLYVSYSHSLAKKQTQTIRQIISMPLFKKLFNVDISDESSAKDNFDTTQGGSVYAAGAGGTITGRGAGIQHCNRFGGAIVIDDIHKPAEATSDTIRQATKDWYLNTLLSRVNSPDTPIIYIGQRVHEDDVAANLLLGYDGSKWDIVTLPALDSANNALLPSMHSVEQLLNMKDKLPYEFAAQYQQDPIPAGGGLFKADWFHVLEIEPKILATFITVDTAETGKNYNDATVFSFWGLYKIEHVAVETELYGLHWLDCIEEWYEPKDLLDAFMQFYADCMRHKVKPKVAAIEKKSTGVSLISFLNSLQGLRVIDIERNRNSGSKTKRFLDAQPYIASKQITLPAYSKHTQKCIEHMSKITANDSHRRDDIADTCTDAIDLALVKKLIHSTVSKSNSSNDLISKMAAHNRRQDLLRRQIYGTR